MDQSWAALLDDVHNLVSRARESGGELWFRGQAKSSWSLTSALHRSVDEFISTAGQDVHDLLKRDMLRAEFKALYHSFKSDAWTLLQSQERGIWSLIFQMQHHGIPTRLLDWTESFACALYFAHSGRNADDDAVIFILNPTKLNSLTVGLDSHIVLDDDMTTDPNIRTNRWHPKFVPPLEDLPTIAVTPCLSNRRMVAQRSAFTLCGDSFESLELQYPDAIKKIALPASTYAAAEQFLDLVGVGPETYFPDFDGLHRKYQLRRASHMRELAKLRPK